MDLVDYAEEVFEDIKTNFEKLNTNSTYEEQNVSYVPVSALNGDNVAKKSDSMSWYVGDTILEHLEKLDTSAIIDKGLVRFPVQSVIRPKKEEFHDFRGFAGKIYGGNFQVGDAVTVFPSLTKTKIKAIYFYNKSFDKASSGSSVTITLEDEVNITRGDMLVKTNEEPKVDKSLHATVCWMDNKQLAPGTKYIVQHNSNRVLSKISAIKNIILTDFSGSKNSDNKLALNEIGEVEIKLSKPIFYDSYIDNKSNGSFILIDEQTNATAGVGFIN